MLTRIKWPKPFHLHPTVSVYSTCDILRRDGEITKVKFDALNTDNSAITSCIALYNMALRPGLSSVSSVLQHWQWAASLVSGHWRSLSTAGERPECNGFSLHSFSMVSWQGQRNSGESAAVWSPANVFWKCLLTLVSFDILDNIWKAWGEC